MRRPLRHSSSRTALADHVDGEDKTTTLIQGDGSCIGFPKRESGQDRIHQRVGAVAAARGGVTKRYPLGGGLTRSKAKPPTFLAGGLSFSGGYGILYDKGAADKRQAV